MLQRNIILETDSYKFGHFEVYPEDTTWLHASIIPRVKGKTVMLAMLQAWVKNTLLTPITQDNIDEAEEFAALHGVPFPKHLWQIVLNEYDGYLPLYIRGIPEGMPVPSGIPLVTVECFDKRLYFLVGWIEASIQRAVWYGSTIASKDYEFKKELKRYYELSGADLSLLDFALHDFGARGVTSGESAMYGGGAHLFNFQGSDTVEGVRFMNWAYNSKMSAYSVRATEHSVECSYGLSSEEESTYLGTILDKWAQPGRIVSIVIDGRDTIRAASKLCTEFRDKIISSGAKVVFRPDSGDMMDIVPHIIKMQAEAFGYDLTTTGYKKIKHVGVIQGDGVDRLNALSLIGKLMTMGYSADNVVFGSGGALLQKVDRDTYKFAMKITARGTTDGKSLDVIKDPITDPGKKSLAGVLEVVQNLTTKEILVMRENEYDTRKFMTMMCTYYTPGGIDPYFEDTLDNIRTRCKV